MPRGLDAATRARTIAGVEARMARIAPGAHVSATGRDLTIRPRPDAFTLEALARRDRTTLVATDAVSPGRCSGGGLPLGGAARRCVRLGAPVTDTAAVSATEVSSQAIDGWGVDVTIDPDGYPAFRTAVAPHRGATVAVTSGDDVLGSASLSNIGLRSRIAGQLRRSDARRIAAALLVATDLPVALQARRPRATPGTDAGDAWMTQLTVDVCGRRLPPAPALTSEVGLHSHGDGLVYVHSLPAAQVGRRPTLGQFLAKGGWRVTADRLRLWDGVDVRAGDACAGQRDTAVRFTVDGEPGTGSPADAVLAPGRTIVVSFGPRDAPVPAPPAPSPLLRTVWGPRLP